MAYDLVSIVRRLKTRRRSVAARAVVPTRARTDALAAVYLDVVRAWRDQITGRVLPAYGALHDRLMRDDAQDQMSEALAAAAAAVSALAIQYRPRLIQWVAEFDAWHMQRFAQTIRAAVVVDPLPMMSPIETAPARQVAVERMAALLGSVDDQTRGRVAQAVWSGVAQRQPLAQVSAGLRDVIAASRRRATGIAEDKTDTISSEMDEARQAEAGLDWFRWRHSRNRRPRHWHQARDGKLFRRGQIPPDDMAGVPPHCDCKAEPWIGLDD